MATRRTTRTRTNGRSYVRRGESVPMHYQPRKGEVWYIDGRKATIKRVGDSDGTPYVWFVRAVDGTTAMSVRNLIQAGRVEAKPNPRRRRTTARRRNGETGPTLAQVQAADGAGRASGKALDRKPSATGLDREFRAWVSYRNMTLTAYERKQLRAVFGRAARSAYGSRNPGKAKRAARTKYQGMVRKFGYPPRGLGLLTRKASYKLDRSVQRGRFDKAPAYRNPSTPYYSRERALAAARKLRAEGKTAKVTKRWEGNHEVYWVSTTAKKNPTLREHLLGGMKHYTIRLGGLEMVVKAKTKKAAMAEARKYVRKAA